MWPLLFGIGVGGAYSGYPYLSWISRTLFFLLSLHFAFLPLRASFAPIGCRCSPLAQASPGFFLLGGASPPPAWMQCSIEDPAVAIFAAEPATSGWHRTVNVNVGEVRRQRCSKSLIVFISLLVHSREGKSAANLTAPFND